MASVYSEEERTQWEARLGAYLWCGMEIELGATEPKPQHSEMHNFSDQ